MKNALLGYTYQQHVTLLLIALMDVERFIDEIEIEASVDHKFDDVILYASGDKYTIQIKDIENISLDDLVVSPGQLSINGKQHKTSEHTNLVFFKHIEIKCNCEILGFKAYLLNGVYLISASREVIERNLTKLYQSSAYRRQIIQSFLSKKLDDRLLKIKRDQLPAISVLDTKLIETSVKLSRKILDFENILMIEGKPGVGKSHLVSYLQQQFKGNILYRFWISNQDRAYEQRLQYSEFMSDLSKKLFNDPKERSETDILDKLSSSVKTLILDGLDHVENYRPVDLHNFVEFIDRASTHCKIIVLTRPLKIQVTWKKQILNNWNRKQTDKILKQVYRIDNYSIANDIYELTAGYPILVKYISEQYKKDGIIPASAALETVNQYYDTLFQKESGKQALSLFLCCRGYLMLSELCLFLGEYTGTLVEEFINERPYLFEIKLNRISLYHDSFLTYLKNCNLNFFPLLENVNSIVVKSLLANNTRFQSRVAHFDIPLESKVRLLKHYACTDNFKAFVVSIVDYEALREFYNHLRQMLCDVSAETLEVYEYYDFALIINLVSRDHFSIQNDVYYTFAKALSSHGYTEEDITSSGYLFGMLLFIKKQDASFLYNLRDDHHYDTSHFYEDLETETQKEEDFFFYQSKPFKRKSIEKALGDSSNFHYRKLVKDVLVNIYIHSSQQEKFSKLYCAVVQLLEGQDLSGAITLSRALQIPNWQQYEYSWILNEVKQDLLSLGFLTNNNDYIHLSLEQYLQKYKYKGSYTLGEELLSYLRLALYKQQHFDINSISFFWTKYYQRKDYSLHSLDYALTTFERRGIINWRQSVELIREIQDISEKGYRWLLGGYLMLHEPNFILQLLEEFKFKSLRIEWFLLDPEYIDVLPDEVFYFALNEQFVENSYSKQLDISDILNLLSSKRVEDFKRAIKLRKFVVVIKEGEEGKDLLEKHKIDYETLSNDNNHDYDKSPESRFREGILDIDNQDFIITKGLQPAEVALLTNGDRAALATPEIFNRFSDSHVQNQMKQILFNSLTGKTNLGNYFSIPWLLPGTMIQVISDCNMQVDFNKLFNSFQSFLNLSMFDISRIPTDR